MESDANLLTHAAPVHTTGVVAAPARVVWSAVLGGAAVAVATWMLLQLLGLGLGLKAVEVTSASSLQGSAMGVGVVGIAAPVIAFFVGGLVAGRAAANGLGRTNSALAGLVTWGVGTIAGMLVIGMVVSSLVGGAVAIGTSAAGVAGDAIGNAAGGLATRAHPGDVLRGTGTEADDRMRADLEARATSARDTAIRAAQTTAEASGQLMLGLFGALLLSAGAAVGGAVLAAGSNGRARARRLAGAPQR
jgi:hypothetical protein